MSQKLSINYFYYFLKQRKVNFKIQSTLCITNEFGPGVLFAIESVRYIESYQPCLGPLVDNEMIWCLEQNILNEYC